MLNIIEKKNCSGCCVCVDVCLANAISLEVDEEGFWYPEVDQEKCTRCGLCQKTCPELNVDDVPMDPLENAEFYAARHQDDKIRLDSTSGGMFSAFANNVFSEGGYVGGAVYNDDFSVQHILTNCPDDLLRLRSSKYLQSFCAGFYKEVKSLLDQGEKVLVCGCPCQISAMKLFLGKEYEKLILCDFICRGINSPKIFRKYLDSLEEVHESKVVYAKAKSKDHGWRKLTFKATFGNGNVYYGDRQSDNFTRGYLRTGCFCRPSCYECRFKEPKRASDITLGDFWGIENVAPEMDDDTGTSLVICNTGKGKEAFRSVRDCIDDRLVDCDSILSGNVHLLNSLPSPSIDRAQFFKDIDQFSYSKVAGKYFPHISSKVAIRSSFRKAKRFAKQLRALARLMRASPRAWSRFVWLNFLRKNTKSSFFKGHYIIPTPYCVFDIDRNARIFLNGTLQAGRGFVKGSKLETRIKMKPGSELVVNDCFTLGAGGDVQLFDNSSLLLEGGGGAGCNILCQVVCASKIVIGRNTLIGRNVIIRDYDAHYVIQDGYKISAPIAIGSHCWLGDGAMITKGVTVGNGSIVAARSFVLSNVPKRSLVGGMPAILLNDDIDWTE